MESSGGDDDLCCTPFPGLADDDEAMSVAVCGRACSAM